MSCKHVNHVISEEYLYLIDHISFQDEVFHEHKTCETTGRILVKCIDCSLDRVYTKSTLPNWVKRRLDEIHGK